MTQTFFGFVAVTPFFSAFDVLTRFNWAVPGFFLSERSLFLDSNFVSLTELLVSFISLALRSEKNSSEVGLKILCRLVS